MTEGASVRHDQVLLLMPDLDQMQVKVGIHESLIDRIQKGLVAKVRLPEIEVEGKVKTVATIAQPAGWWTGNVVKYDTVIDLPRSDELKPGMTAEVEIMLAEHTDALTVPVAAVVETDTHKLCWVKTSNGPERRSLILGDSNDIFIIVKDGLNEGDEVILEPLRFVDEASGEALSTIGATDSTELAPGDSKGDAKANALSANENLVGQTAENPREIKNGN